MPRDRVYETVEDRSRRRRREIPDQPDNPYPFSNVDRDPKPPPDNPSFRSGRGVHQPPPPPPPPPQPPAPTSKRGSCKEPSQKKRRGDDQDPDDGYLPKRYVPEGWGTQTQPKNNADTPTTESGSNQDGYHRRHYQSGFQTQEGYFPEEDSRWPEAYALGASRNSRQPREIQDTEDRRDSIPRYLESDPLPEMLDAATLSDIERNESRSDNASSQHRQGRKKRATGADSHIGQRYS